MSFHKRAFLISLTLWLFISQTGLAWTVSTCLITGQKKIEFGQTAKCCKRPSQSPEGGFSTKISKKSCCKVESQVLKLHAAQEGKISEKKNFQNDLKNLPFFIIFFQKHGQFEKKLVEFFPKTFVKSGQFLLKMIQVFII